MNTLSTPSQTFAAIQPLLTQLQSVAITLNKSSLSQLHKILSPLNRTSCALSSIEQRINEILADLIQNNDEKQIIDEILTPLLNELKGTHAKTVSHTNTSFFENRNGFSAQELLSSKYTPLSPHTIFKKPTSSIKLSARGFKTLRTLEKDSEKTGILKKLLNQSQTSKKSDLQDLLSNKKQLSDLLSTRSEQTRKSIIEDDKMKIAFAEGYLSRELTGSSAASKEKQMAARLRNLFFWCLFIGIMFSFISRSFEVAPTQNGTTVKFRMGNSAINEVKAEDVNIKFSDVKGVDEAKEELKEIVDYLRDPEKYTRLGARLPRGVLLVGPPGTGKTLLAKATAGEAGVSFFHANGSEFDEMFVGTGAKKVRNLFAAARARAPCVIFIDEIDSVGAKRSNSSLHPYANQTINQLLAEMDGFDKSEGIIVLAATNRRQFLDPALVRPGRFDVEVRVDKPDLKGRIELVELYLGKVCQSVDIDPTYIARLIVGFTGADIENLINQAALKAAQENCNEVNMNHIQWARDKILMGPERLSKIQDADTNRVTAYHEAGHAVVGYFTKENKQLHKVTILPRGLTLGHTSIVPEKDSYNETKAQLFSQIDLCMGGRVAEELIFGNDKITTGAGSDFQKATQIATMMVKKFGMSDKIGYRYFADAGEEIGEAAPSVSAQTQELLDQEINRVLQESYERTKSILKTHMHELKALAEALLVYETLDANEVKMVFEGKKLPAKFLKKDKEKEKEKESTQEVVDVNPKPTKVIV